MKYQSVIEDKVHEIIDSATIEIAKTIAWHHCDRKQWVGHPSGPQGKRARNDYYAEHEYKTFIPAADGVLALLESWVDERDK